MKAKRWRAGDRPALMTEQRDVRIVFSSRMERRRAASTGPVFRPAGGTTEGFRSGYLSKCKTAPDGAASKLLFTDKFKWSE